MKDAEAALAALEQELARFVAGFDAGAFPEPGVLAASWDDLQARFASVRAHLDSAAAPTAETERCLRLYALAVALLAERSEHLAAERAACRAARQRVHALRPAETLGDSCDVRG